MVVLFVFCLHLVTIKSPYVMSNILTIPSQNGGMCVTSIAEQPTTTLSVELIMTCLLYVNIIILCLFDINVQIRNNDMIISVV